MTVHYSVLSPPTRSKKACPTSASDFRSLRFVLAAAEHLSIHRAATALQTDRATVSRALRAFENRVGVSIFERGAFGLRLTDAGSHLVEEIAPALRQIEHAVHFAAAAGRVETGTVRIGIVSTLAGGFLRKLISRYELEFPGVTLTVRDGGQREHMRAIWARHLDVAFLAAIEDAHGLEVPKLWSERILVAVSHTNHLARRAVLDWPDLHDQRVIVSKMAAGPDVYDYVVRRNASVWPPPVIDFCDTGQETLMHLVALDKGVTLVAESWREMHIPGLALIPLASEDDTVFFSAVWSPSCDNPALRRFLSFARELAAKQRSRRTQ